MKKKFQKIKSLIFLKAKYAAASATATAVDYGFYYIFFYFFGISKTTANFISYPIGVVFNFFLQKTFIFSMTRELKTTFGLAMMVSAGGWAMNATLFYFLMKIPFFQEGNWHWAAKIIVNGIIFLYNFYGKRYVFEKKFF